MKRPEWFPDWSREACTIVASGPSASAVPLDEGRGRARFMAVNTSWQLAPWADALYGCDYAWWASVNGLRSFQGLRICSDLRAESAFGIRRVKVRIGDNRMLFDRPGEVGWGGNGGFQAVNIAAQAGCRKILLVGFDMSLEAGEHWHGRHGGGLKNPKAESLQRWRRLLDAVAPSLAARGVEVLNCSLTSALTAYPKVDFREALA